MKNTLFPLLLCLALLCGCAAQNTPAEAADQTDPPVTRPAEAPITGNTALLEVLNTDDAVTRYACHTDVHGILPTENGLLLFSGEPNTVLTLLDPVSLEVLAVFDTGFSLRQENASVQLLDSGLSFFNGHTSETVVLDNTLREIRRISAPQDMTGMPLLSGNGQSLYYCTASAIRALDLDSGISRILKEAAYPVQGLSGILLEDTILQVSITEADGTWRTLFLSAETGQLLHITEGNRLPKTGGQNYFLQDQTFALFAGRTDGSPMIFEPLHSDLGCWYLPTGNQAACAGLTENGTILELYDLNSGYRQAETVLDDFLFPEQLVQMDDGAIWFLMQGENNTLLCRWDPSDSMIRDDTLYLSTRYTRENPDYEGLAVCTLHAQALSEKYGLEILIYKDAAATEPWDYHLEYEHQVSVLQRELERLDKHLAYFPEGFLQTLKEKFTALKICIVRSAKGAPESGSPDAVNGIQFLEGFDAYIVLASDHDTEYALYHELCHLMETVVLTESTAYDRWDNLNPEDFRYDNDYSANRNRDGSPWLKPGREYFIDTYSMSYAKEDRARLLEYAMTSGHETLFQSPNLQRKLLQLCIGIREAFDLENNPEPFLWEQYLSEPLYPVK